jgi:CHASE2 domain-containing sensor protein
MNAKIIKYCIFAIIVASVVVALSGRPFFLNLEYMARDLLFKARNPAVMKPSDEIIIVEVTQSDILTFGRWPWPRSEIAHIIDVVNELKPKAILVDLLFSGHTTPQDDQLLVDAVRRAGNVYLPYALPFAQDPGMSIVYPFKELKESAKGIGIYNSPLDQDGKIRKTFLFDHFERRIHKRMELILIQDVLNLPSVHHRARSLVLSNEDKTKEIPIYKKNLFLINWYGTYKQSFEKIAYGDLLKAGESKDFQVLKKLKGKIVFVGLNLPGMYDTHSTPVQPMYPGVGIVATITSNILNDDYLSPVPSWLNVLLVYLFALVPVLYVLSNKPYKGMFMLALIIGSVAMFFHVFRHNFLLNVSPPYLAFLGSYIVVSLCAITESAYEKIRLLRLSTQDELTGLSNVRFFKENLKLEIQKVKREGDQTFSLILVDIDKFKDINDQHGHLAGDCVIATVAKSLNQLVRKTDIASRYGGDELVFLLKNTSLDSCLAIFRVIF